MVKSFECIHRFVKQQKQSRMVRSGCGRGCGSQQSLCLIIGEVDNILYHKKEKKKRKTKREWFMYIIGYRYIVDYIRLFNHQPIGFVILGQRRQQKVAGDETTDNVRRQNPPIPDADADADGPRFTRPTRVHVATGNLSLTASTPRTIRERERERGFWLPRQREPRGTSLRHPGLVDPQLCRPPQCVYS
ncbi:hypothetical protein MUK42_34842 [Musa troglodytarum]|uniref:Uncharacterized protein n=1 Tax=Musa troglodytarum TaxID=320322 RepID=A0A9E7JCD0_9LILI|nr:hypothetical protein MUK42_34842 [Musa troglodytarum]